MHGKDSLLWIWSLVPVRLGTSGLDHPETKEGAGARTDVPVVCFVLNNALLPSWLVKATIPSPQVSPLHLQLPVSGLGISRSLSYQKLELTPGTAGSHQDCAQAPGFKCLLRVKYFRGLGAGGAGLGDFCYYYCFGCSESSMHMALRLLLVCSSLGFVALRHMGSWFPDQGMNLCPLPLDFAFRKSSMVLSIWADSWNSQHKHKRTWKSFHSQQALSFKSKCTIPFWTPEACC